MTAESSARRIVAERSGGWCEARIPGKCEGRATNWHHRKNRSQGGKWDAVNGLALCGSGSTGCHGWITENPAESYRKGWAVRGCHNPGGVAVWIGGRWVTLSDDGRYVELPPEAE